MTRGRLVVTLREYSGGHSRIREELLDVLSNNVKFQVYLVPYLDILEICVGVGEGYDRHGKESVGTIEAGQTDSIHADGTFFNGDISIGCIVLECKYPAPLLVINGGYYGRCVYMTLHDMPVEAAIACHAALEVDEIAWLQMAEV